ncbi:hypothetical protein KC19_9G130200, partial [Ceratodon purpureus]
TFYLLLLDNIFIIYGAYFAASLVHYSYCMSGLYIRSDIHEFVFDLQCRLLNWHLHQCSTLLAHLHPHLLQQTFRSLAAQLNLLLKLHPRYVSIPIIIHH